FLIFSSLFVIAKTFYQPVAEEVKYFVDQQTQKEYVVAAPQEAATVEEEHSQIAPKGALAQALNIKPVEVLVPQDPDFSIVIPKIAANANVIQNVDPANEPEYLDALQHGVAHA